MWLKLCRDSFTDATERKFIRGCRNLSAVAKKGLQPFVGGRRAGFGLVPAASFQLTVLLV